MKHTPGPWLTVDSNRISCGGLGLCRIVYVRGGQDIAYIQPIGTQDNGNSNAHLIVAAPNMLAAFADIMHELGVPGPESPANVANAYRIAENAIAEATK